MEYLLMEYVYDNWIEIGKSYSEKRDARVFKKTVTFVKLEVGKFYPR